MGEEGAVYADCEGHKGVCRAMKVDVKDTTGAGDSFCAGVASGLTYGKSLQDSVEIGTRLAASAIASYENVWSGNRSGGVRTLIRKVRVVKVGKEK